jgi:hypothetical protein
MTWYWEYILCPTRFPIFSRSYKWQLTK